MISYRIMIKDEIMLISYQMVDHCIIVICRLDAI